MWTIVSSAITASATSVLRETTSGNSGSGTVKSGVASAGRGHESSDVVRRARPRWRQSRLRIRRRTTSSRSETRPTVRTPRAGRRTRRRRAAAARRAPRRPSRRRTRARRRAPRRRASGARVGDELRDENRDEEDAAADDVGDDDGRGVERAETAIERVSSTAERSRAPRHHCVISCRSIGKSADARPLRRAVLREQAHLRVDELRVLQHLLAAIARSRCSRAAT